METKQLGPAEIIRGEMGTWTHPVYSNYLSENLSGKEYIGRDEWEQLKNHFNIQTVTYWMEGHVNPDNWETMMDASDISGWDPIAPIGFFLIDINFGEDDAYALFAQNNIELKGKAFEAWHESKYGEHIIWSNGSPASHIHNDRWQGWLAATANAQTVPEGFVLVPKEQFESLNEFKDLYKRAIINAKKRKNQINWAHVANLGVGSGRAVQLCKELGIDPSATNMHAVEAREQSHD